MGVLLGLSSNSVLLLCGSYIEIKTISIHLTDPLRRERPLLLYRNNPRPTLHAINLTDRRHRP